MMGGDHGTDTVSSASTATNNTGRRGGKVMSKETAAFNDELDRAYDEMHRESRANRNPLDETMWCPIEPGVSSTCKHEFGEHFCTTCGMRSEPQHTKKISGGTDGLSGVFFCVKCKDVRRSAYCGVCGGRNAVEPDYAVPSVSVAAVTRILCALTIRYIGISFFVMSPNIFTLFVLVSADLCVLAMIDRRNLKPLYFNTMLEGALTFRLFASFTIWILAFILINSKNGRETYPGQIEIPYKTTVWNGVLVGQLMLEIFVPLLLILMCGLGKSTLLLQN
jgi:hypothetical protein